MIDLYSGTPGSGKSLRTVSKIYYALVFNRPVICNFQIDVAQIKHKRGEFVYLDNSELTPEFLIQYSKNYFGSRLPIEDQILLVIDECQLLFNARDWGKKGRDKWLSFFSQHRKYGYHVILVAQFDGMIDKQIRALIEYEYVHRKLSNFGWRGLFLSLFLGFRSFIAVKVWYPMNMKVDQEIFYAKRKFFRLYHTFGTFDSGDNKAPEQKDKNRSHPEG